MHSARRVWLWISFALICAALLWSVVNTRRSPKTHAPDAINDLSVTSPLNQPGGEAASAESYDLYSALYQERLPEPLVFAADSMTDIPQVNGSCLKPSSPQEHEMADAFETTNQQSHRWEQKFTIPQGYQILSQSEVSMVLSCIETHALDSPRCGEYKQLRHLRFLGIPGFNHAHTRALVSVVKKCGYVCGSGGIFEVEKIGNSWRRTDTTDFTRECSWMY